MTDNQLKKVLKSIVKGLDESSMFDNDGVLMGYVEKYQVSNHKELLDKKNKLIESGEMSQEGFDWILFNYAENDEIMPELRFGFDD